MSPQLTALLVSGLVLIGAGIPLMRRRVPPNRWYGVRLPSTLSDESAWYSVNERSGRDLIVVGTAVVLIALSAPVVVHRWAPEFRTLLVAVVLVAGLAVVTGRAIRHVKRLRSD